MIQGVLHSAILVDDMGKSLDFYQNLLGGKVVFEKSNENNEKVLKLLRYENGSYIELFYPNQNINNSKHPVNHFCLLTDNIVKIEEKLMENNIIITSKVQKVADGNLQLWCLDPNGYRVEIIQMLPDCIELQNNERGDVMNANLVDEIITNRIIVIIRKIYGDQLVQLAKALNTGGIRFMEVTFDQNDSECMTKTPESISTLRKVFGSNMHFGAGTVLNDKQVDAAASAGAEFIISPCVDENTIKRTKELRLVSIPGAMTPSEVVNANKLGADIVKVFPASYLGLKYFKDLIAPLNYVKYMATGGVDNNNFKDFLEAGYCSAGIGSFLANKELLNNKQYSELTKRAEMMCEIARKVD